MEQFTELQRKGPVYSNELNVNGLSWRLKVCVCFTEINITHLGNFFFMNFHFCYYFTYLKTCSTHRFIPMGMERCVANT